MTVSWGVVEQSYGGVYPAGGVASATYNLDVGAAINAGGAPYTSTPTVVVLTIMGFNYHSGLDNTISLNAPGWNVLLNPATMQDHTRIGFNGGKSCVGLLWRRYPTGLPVTGAEVISFTVGRAWTYGDNLTGWPEFRAIWDNCYNAVADPQFTTNYYRAYVDNGGAVMPTATIAPGLVPDPGADGVVVARSAFVTQTASPSGTPTFTLTGSNWGGRSGLHRYYRTTTAVSAMPTFNGGGQRLAAWWGYSVRGNHADHCTVFEATVSAVSGTPGVDLSVASSAFPDALSNYQITFADSSPGLTLPASSLLSAGPWNLGAMAAGQYVKYQIARTDGAHIDGSCVMRATDTTFGLYWDVTVECPRKGAAIQFRRGRRAHIAGATGVSIQGR